MKVTYLNHSGFLLEWEHSYWLFDYYKGDVPVQFLKSRAITPFATTSGEILQIHTLQSTDCGCAFFIEYNGNSIYHAGDLHWWYWEGEDISWNKKMSADYKKEMEYLIDKNIDLAFVPLDPRQGNDYARGIEFFLNNTDTRHIFPMHFWNNFDIIIRYQQDYSVPVHTTFHTPQQDGQCFEIML